MIDIQDFIRGRNGFNIMDGRAPKKSDSDKNVIYTSWTSPQPFIIIQKPDGNFHVTNVKCMGVLADRHLKT